MLLILLTLNFIFNRIKFQNQPQKYNNFRIYANKNAFFVYFYEKSAP